MSGGQEETSTSLQNQAANNLVVSSMFTPPSHTISSKVNDNLDVVSTPSSTKDNLSTYLISHTIESEVEDDLEVVPTPTFTSDNNPSAFLFTPPLPHTIRSNTTSATTFTNRAIADVNVVNQGNSRAQMLCGLSYSVFKDNDKDCFLLTGLKKDVLDSLIIYMKKYYSETYRSSMAVEEQIVLTLIRLRHNITFDLLAYLRGVAKSTAVDCFWRWIDLMYLALKPLICMADRGHIFDTIPPVFKQKFPRLTSIIDCFEVFMESPRNLLARAQVFSQYKRHCTIKVFISCTPLGAINFISKCWGGRASDIQIVRESGFTTLRYHHPGDQILADRGFTLREDFALNSGSELLIPAFTKGKKQLAAAEIETTRKIASVRIHIERVIGLLKNRYTILKGILPLRTVKSMLDETSCSPIANCDKIVHVCAALVNLGESIVYPNK